MSDGYFQKVGDVLFEKFDIDVSTFSVGVPVRLLLLGTPGGGVLGSPPAGKLLFDPLAVNLAPASEHQDFAKWNRYTQRIAA